MGGPHRGGLCAFSEKCGTALAMEHNGDVYSCDHYVYPRYCRECEVRHLCHGECPKHRLIRTPDGESGLNYLCRAYKTFFFNVSAPAMQRMAGLLRAGRAPAEIMRAGG